MTPHDLAEILPLLRTAQHVDAVRALADALEARLTDPSALALDAALGFTAPEAPRKRPGPSKARQRATDRRNAALRLYWREALPGHSAGAAAASICARIARYANHRLVEDMREGKRPVTSLEQIAFDAAKETIKMPNKNSLRLILLGHR